MSSYDRGGDDYDDYPYDSAGQHPSFTVDDPRGNSAPNDFHIVAAACDGGADFDVATGTLAYRHPKGNASGGMDSIAGA